MNSPSPRHFILTVAFLFALVMFILIVTAGGPSR